MSQPSSPAVRGYVDSLKNGELAGWCGAKGHPEKFACELFIGETPYQSTTADIFRLDLLEAGINDGRHGFKFDLKTLDLDAIIQNKLRHLSIRAAGTSVKLEASVFVPFYIKNQAPLHQGPYLASFFSEQDKIDSYNTCHKFLLEKLRENLTIPKPLWIRHIEGHTIAIVLKHADFAPLEGELSVTVMADGDPVYHLTFSIIQGRTVGHPDPLILFIGGLQGRPYRREKIIEYTKMNEDLHPRLLLFTAILALCEVWNITTIAGVAARSHISCNTPARLESFAKIYDVFWRDRGGTASPHDAEVYLIPAKPASPPKPAARHHHRTLQRRSIREKIKQEILRAFGL